MATINFKPHFGGARETDSVQVAYAMALGVCGTFVESAKGSFDPEWIASQEALYASRKASLDSIVASEDSDELKFLAIDGIAQSL